jgi:hypothetical protein
VCVCGGGGAAGRRKLQNEGSHDFYSSTNVSVVSSEMLHTLCSWNLPAFRRKRLSRSSG